jgi:hypothetical protein
MITGLMPPSGCWARRPCGAENLVADGDRRADTIFVEEARRYRYTGPREFDNAHRSGAVVRVGSSADLSWWLSTQAPTEVAEPFTYVVDVQGQLWLAPRRSEHIACAGGHDVLAAGDIGFAHGPNGWSVAVVSNQSTGYCPDLESWPALARSLDHARIAHPDAFTHPVVFRLCRSCRQRNVVHDNLFVCALCEGELPSQWNFDR